jgi:hypothetical protein
MEDRRETATRWCSLHAAADFLGMTADALRRCVERRAMKMPDGGTEARLDGVRARKFGRLWRVMLSSEWTRKMSA